MLAQNFKAPSALKISDVEFEALVKVLGMLERGELIYSPAPSPVATDMGFYMGCQYMQHKCGTLACIGGWVAILTHQPDPQRYVDQYMEGGPLQKLYWQYPNSEMSVARAAVALRSYLTYGDPRWAEKVAH
jgi:hypothetical protein